MERNDKAAIEALLKRHGFHFSKSMGQNFLIDPSVCPRMAAALEAALSFFASHYGYGSCG